MIRTDIVRERGPESLGQCVRWLTEADRDYFRRRAAQEAEAASASSCCEARIAHEELAAAYRQLCSAGPGEADTHLVFELAIFQFNPNPAD